jgi:mannose-6-phosphate isomerase-like protein (cupin superfamily)
MHPQPVNLASKLAKFSDHWSPKIIVEMNDHQFKLVKFHGEFLWHRHDDTDEVFIVIDGAMTIHFREGDVHVQAGELIMVPRGVEHKTSANAECHALIIEKAGTVNTGNTVGALTAPADSWV